MPLRFRVAPYFATIQNLECRVAQSVLRSTLPKDWACFPAAVKKLFIPLSGDTFCAVRLKSFMVVIERLECPFAPSHANVRKLKALCYVRVFVPPTPIAIGKSIDPLKI